LPSPTVETATKTTADTAAVADLAIARWAMTTPALGELARLLREASGLTRRQLGDAVGLSEMSVKNFELGRCIPTRDTMNRLLAHPALERLVEMAEAEGIAVKLRPDPPQTLTSSRC